MVDSLGMDVNVNITTDMLLRAVNTEISHLRFLFHWKNYDQKCGISSYTNYS